MKFGSSWSCSRFPYSLNLNVSHVRDAMSVTPSALPVSVPRLKILLSPTCWVLMQDALATSSWDNDHSLAVTDYLMWVAYPLTHRPWPADAAIVVCSVARFINKNLYTSMNLRILLGSACEMSYPWPWARAEVYVMCHSLGTLGCLLWKRPDRVLISTPELRRLLTCRTHYGRCLRSYGTIFRF